MGVPPQVKWTERLVIDALRAAYLPAQEALKTEEWAFLTQVPLRCPQPGYTVAEQTYWTTNERTIDVLLVRNWAGGKHGHERLAFEVKVSKADYRNETDTKRAPAEASAHRCAYAAPAGLIDPDTLPEGWGLLEVQAIGNEHTDHVRYETTWRRKPTRRTPTANLDYLVSAGFRRASRAEEKIRRGETAAAEIVALRAENESLKAIAVRATEARDREMARAKAARSELLALAGAQSCGECGGMLTWKRGGHHDSRWVHPDRAVADACDRMRWRRYEEARRTDPFPPYPEGPAPAAVTAEGTAP